MPEDKTLDEKRFTLTWKVALPIMGFLLVVSNLFTRQISTIEENRVNIIENNNAARRRISNSEEKIKLKQEIVMLKYKLEVCLNK